MLSTQNLSGEKIVSVQSKNLGGPDLEYLVKLYPVWRRVFRHLNAHDLVNCMNAFPIWHKWLSTTQAVFILPKIMPFLMKELPKKDFLSCRLVCNRWKDDIDHIYQTHPSNVSFESITFPATSPLPLTIDPRRPHDEEDFQKDFGISFENSADVQNFLEDMKPYDGNPFPGRRILLSASCSDEEYRDSMKILLQRYGKQIWYADISLLEDDGVQIRGSLSRHIRDYLLLLPNLKKLSIRTAPGNVENVEDAYSEEDDEFGDLISYFKDYLWQTSLIELPQLETLEVFDAHHNVDELVKSVLATWCMKHSLKRLRLRRNSYRAIYDLENLEELEVAAFLLEDLTLLKKSMPPLKKITLGLHSRKGCSQKVNVATVFKGLEPFGGTLKCVKVLGNTTIYSSSDTKNTCASFRVNLPNLEQLSLTLDGCLDYFLGLSSLKNLTVYDSTLRPWGEESELVEYHGFQTRMGESNIWRLMPSLMTFACGRWEHDEEFGRKYHRAN